MKLITIILFFLPIFSLGQTVWNDSLSFPDSVQFDLIYKWINSIVPEKVNDDTIPLPYTILSTSDSNFKKGMFIPLAFLDSIQQERDSLIRILSAWKVSAKVYQASVELYEQIYDEMEKQLEAEKRKNDLIINQ